MAIIDLFQKIMSKAKPADNRTVVGTVQRLESRNGFVNLLASYLDANGKSWPIDIAFHPKRKRLTEALEAMFTGIVKAKQGAKVIGAEIIAIGPITLPVKGTTPKLWVNHSDNLRLKIGKHVFKLADYFDESPRETSPEPIINLPSATMEELPF